MKDGKCTSLGDHSFALCDMETGMGSCCTICGISSYEAVKKHEGAWPISANAKGTPHDVDQARNQQLDQLRANAKAHKNQIVSLTARLGLVTQQRDDAAAQLMVKEQEAAFFRAEFERHCDVKKVKVGGRDGYMMQESISPPTMVTALTAWLIGFSVISGGVTAYALAKWMGIF